MEFREEFLDSLLSNEILTPSISLTTYIPESIPVSEKSSKALFYLQGYGDLNVNAPYYYEIENLNSYLILYTLEGKGIISYRGRTYLLTAGSLIFIDCHLKYSIKIHDCNSWHFHHVFFNGGASKYYYNLYIHDNSIMISLNDYSPIPNIFDNLKHNHFANTIFDELRNSRTLTDLLSEILFEKNHKRKEKENIPSYILDIKRQFENNYNEFYSLDALALKYNKSKYRISREFISYLELSPINYLINCRMNAAKNLLWTTDYTINEISSLIGIDNTSHFIRLFKKTMGVTPLNYRRQRP
ncbi:hypothetical protein GCM10023142_17920 [Anaerocolumna aminovalerica]|uniref:AraC-type DNA-binding protein n=1 Tax=Anaerocolumna aminovalerica TaxID=1527 RepID=A0A1I5FZD2_9FIRM|nr:AraC family transcriptional regulator [Anaerocolumna aminovalerica]SFO29016.1 AraC-type DNA-binding protein [Anaerocolumna aminovalerica]